MPELAGQGGRRDGDNGTLGMGQAVAAHLGKGQPPQRAPAASAHNQHIVRAAGQVDQHPAHRPAFDMRLYPRIVGNLTPHCHQRVPELLAGKVPARVSQFARRPDPVGAVTARQFPGDDRDQDRIERAGQALPVAQCMQAARRPARPDEHPAQAEHRSARFLTESWMTGHLLTPSSARSLHARGLDGANGGHHQDTQSVRACTRRDCNHLRGTGKEQRRLPPRGSTCVRGSGQARLGRAVCRCAANSHQETAVHESEDHEHRRPGFPAHLARS